MNKKNLSALMKAIGKHVLPEEVVQEYRRQLQIVDCSVLIITLDSCRYDTFVKAYEEQLPAKNIKRAYSPCNWTLPSHESIVRGFLPYGDFVDPLEGKGYNRGIPLSSQHKYSFGATAMPYLSSSKALMNNLHTYFSDYFCAEDAGSAEQVLDKAAEFMQDTDEEFFGLINLGETHSPYRDFDTFTTDSLIEGITTGEFLYSEVHEWQVESAKYILNQIRNFRECIPSGTTVIVTSDHGELFGEEDAFGHNQYKEAVFHEKLFEVPLVYWQEK